MTFSGYLFLVPAAWTMQRAVQRREMELKGMHHEMRELRAQAAAEEEDAQVNMADLEVDIQVRAHRRCSRKMRRYDMHSVQSPGQRIMKAQGRVLALAFDCGC